MHARPQLFSSHGNPPAPSFSCINFLSSVQQELTCDGQQERASVRLRIQWIRNNNSGDDEGKSRNLHKRKRNKEAGEMPFQGNRGSFEKSPQDRTKPARFRGQ